MKNNPPAPCTSSTIYYHKKHPKEPQCDNTVPINNEFSIIIIVVAILLFVFRKLNKKKIMKKIKMKKLLEKLYDWISFQLFGKGGNFKI